MNTTYRLMGSSRSRLAGGTAWFLALVLSAGLARAADPPGLVGYWTFEEGSGTTTADLSGNNFTGTFDNVATWGGPTWTNSPLGNYALSFDGSNDRITIGNPPALQMTGAMTLSAWVYVRGFSSNGRIITKGGGSGSRGWALNVEGGGGANTGSFQIGANTTTTFSVVTATAIASNRWIHLAGVYVPGVSMRIYTNGYLNNEVTLNVPAAQNNTTLNVTIGARPIGAPDNPFNGLIDEVRVFNRALSEEEIRTLPEVVPTPLTWVTQPVSRTAQNLTAVTFTAQVSGSPPHDYQWFSNGVAIAGARSRTHTIPLVTLDMDGTAYSVSVSNLAYGLVSTNAILSVIEDRVPPTILSVGSVDGRTIGVCFSERVSPDTGGDGWNYRVNDDAVTVTSAALRPDGSSVVLTLMEGQQLTGSFTVLAPDVTDLVGNPVGPDSVGNGVVAGLTPADVGGPLQPGAAFSCATGVIELTAGGADLWGTADQGHTALKSMAGDFDFKVRVTGLTPVDSIAKAGLMARATLDAGSPTVHLLANPPAPTGRGYIQAGIRTTANGATVAWGTTYTAAVIPDVWLRLRRAGDVFQAFRSTNGGVWTLMGQTAQAFGDPMLVGLAATAHNNSSAPTVAEFRDFGSMTFPGATLSITQAPTNTESQYNSVVTFTAAAEGQGAPAEELIYQWQRDDGQGGFDNIPGANSPTLSFLVRPVDDNAQFRVRVYFAGLVETSPPATLTVTPDTTPPAIVAVRARGNPNEVLVVFSEAVSEATAADYFAYGLTVRDTGDPVGVTAAVLGADGRTVTLTIGTMQDDVMYRLTVRDVQDLAEPPNTILPGTQVDFAYSSLVGWWQFEEGSGLTTADATGSGYDGTLVNGPVWVAGLFGNWALQFDGPDDLVNVGNPAAFQITGPLTLSAWVWVNSISANGRIVTKGGVSGQRCWSLNVEGYNAWAFQIASSGTANMTVAVTNVFLNEWVHVAGVYDPTVPVMRLYTNGVLGGELTAGVPTVQYNNSLAVGIGNRSIAGTPWHGKIDEVRIYTRALSGAEVAALAAPPVPLEFGPPTFSEGQIHLNWTGSGRLEWAPTVLGPWTPIQPVPGSPYSEPIQTETNRFYRLNATP
jgi:hypothetical protein